MFHLAYNLVKFVWEKRKRYVTLLLLGLDNAGKTCILSAFLKEPIPSYLVPTVGFNSSDTIMHHKNYYMRLFDLGGGSCIRPIWKHYLAEAHGLFFVLDATDTARFSEVATTLQETLQDPRLNGKPLCILCNKQDLPGATTSDSIASFLLPEGARGRDLRFVECFATHDSIEGIDPRLFEALSWMIASVASKYSSINRKVSTEKAIQLREEMKKKRERELARKQQQREELLEAERERKEERMAKKERLKLERENETSNRVLVDDASTSAAPELDVHDEKEPTVRVLSPKEKETTSLCVPVVGEGALSPSSDGALYDEKERENETSNRAQVVAASTSAASERDIHDEKEPTVRVLSPKEKEAASFCVPVVREEALLPSSDSTLYDEKESTMKVLSPEEKESYVVDDNEAFSPEGRKEERGDPPLLKDSAKELTHRNDAVRSLPDSESSSY